MELPLEILLESLPVSRLAMGEMSCGALECFFVASSLLLLLPIVVTCMFLIERLVLRGLFRQLSIVGLSFPGWLKRGFY